MNSSNCFEYDERLENLVSLLMDRADGRESSNNNIENMVSNIVQSYKKPDTGAASVEKKEISYDLENYDDDKDEEYNNQDEKIKNQFEQKEGKKELESNLAKRLEKQKNEELWNHIENIPLGRQGARMMIIFGDGPNPNPEALSCALMGVRKSLQHAIKEARALRRNMRKEFTKAKTSFNTNVDSNVKEEIDLGMSYRALLGYDRIAYELHCGFDITELQILFPAEINEYIKWKQMHEEYSKNESTNQKEIMEDMQNSSEQKKPKSTQEELTPQDPTEGHLFARLAQFNRRTTYMDYQRYLGFSEDRKKGSFLSKTLIKGKKDWDHFRKNVKQERMKASYDIGSWESLPATSVAFLHFLGFDPNSALPPPNEETTQILGFLAYDIMGKIIEKAIYLRIQGQRKKHDIEDDLLLELQNGEQLDPHDIRKSLESSAIKDTPIYSLTSSDLKKEGRNVSTQLYFGPGFEDRLERELNHLIKTEKEIEKEVTAEEKEIRKRENSFFAKLEATQPSVLKNTIDVVGEQRKQDFLEKKARQEIAKNRDKPTMRNTKSMNKKRKSSNISGALVAEKSDKEPQV